MNKSLAIVSAMALFGAQVAPAEPNYQREGDGRTLDGDWQVLGQEEMTSTRGELGPLAVAGYTIAVGGTSGAATAAIGEYNAVGQVSLGTVAAGAVVGATVATVSVLAAATSSPIAIAGAAAVDVGLGVALDANIPASASIQPSVRLPFEDAPGGAGVEHYLYF